MGKQQARLGIGLADGAYYAGDGLLLSHPLLATHGREQKLSESSRPLKGQGLPATST
jgi:hypothetical protein